MFSSGFISIRHPDISYRESYYKGNYATYISDITRARELKDKTRSQLDTDLWKGFV